MLRAEGISAFGIRPIPSEDLLKQIRLANIKTRAGRVAYLMVLGEDATLGRIVVGISKADGALKWISKVLQERATE